MMNDPGGDDDGWLMLLSGFLTIAGLGAAWLAWWAVVT